MGPGKGAAAPLTPCELEVFVPLENPANCGASSSPDPPGALGTPWPPSLDNRGGWCLNVFGRFGKCSEVISVIT